MSADDFFARQDRHVDPIRREIMAGRPLVVYGCGHYVGYVAEALRACGREGDGLVVHLCDGDFSDVGLGRSCRRPDPDVLPRAGGGDMRGEFLAELRDSRVWDVPSCLAVLPVLHVEEACSGARVVAVVDQAATDAGRAYAAWIAAEMGWAATARGRPGPVLVDSSFRKPPDLRAAGETDGAGHGQDATALEWADRLRRMEGGIPVVACEGLAHARDGDRWIVAFVSRAQACPKTFVFAVGPDGDLQGFEVLGGDCAELPRIVRLVARRGISALGSQGEILVDGLDAPPLAAFDRSLAVVDEALWREMRAGVDVPVAMALGGRAGERVIRWLLADGPHARARREFVLTWPLAGDALIDPAVRGTVDEGGETVTAVARYVRTTPAVARRLVGVMVTLANGRVLSGGRACGCGEILSGIGHDSLPARGDAEGWSWLLDAVGRLDEAAMRACLAPLGPKTVAWLLRPCSAAWAAGRAADPSGPVRAVALDLVPDIGDVASGLAAWLRLLTGRDDLEETALSILCTHPGLPALMRASARWHGDPALNAGGGALPRDCAWPVPFDPVDLGEGWSATALADVMSLVDEGMSGPDGRGIDGLSHCVGGYGRQCQSGRSLVVSIRRRLEGREVRVSTVEFAPDGAGLLRMAGKGYRLVQHRGPGNAAPSGEAEWKLTRLRDALTTGAVPVRPEALVARQEIPPVPATPADAARLLPAWRRVLPRKWARMSLAGITEALAPHAHAGR